MSATGYRMWAVLNPLSPHRIRTMASMLYRDRDALVAYKQEREAHDRRERDRLPVDLQADFDKRFGLTHYEIIPESLRPGARFFEDG